MRNLIYNLYRNFTFIANNKPVYALISIVSKTTSLQVALTVFFGRRISKITLNVLSKPV